MTTPIQALILLTVCRNIITIVRETPIGEYIPFDSAIAFHKVGGKWIIFLEYFIPVNTTQFFPLQVVAVTCLIAAATHTIGHCVNFYHVATQSQEGLQCLFQEAVFGCGKMRVIYIYRIGQPRPTGHFNVHYFRSNFLPTISYWFYNTITGLTGKI